ncbi:hypothetical protein L107_13865 [Cyanobium sp. Copco_Reservoir_LC18]|uniref:helix-turn-helix domain-containing protein n=1 Tax=Cyanobium sp. Copco_Reservoir_LC18 TaxID=1328305 RepID=UPI001359715D|nr:helix-turn-helix domain-containing protein [Cyanobium sp. Copco_Reservoir_LC18]KAF0652400.1 hypothetical protein L107_13865 [Cyanobium sp. Copco_Reservoir_LC18]
MTGVQLLQGITAGTLWAEQLEQLAARAEALDNRPAPPTLPELVELANEAHRYLFLAFSPSVIARSCRLSARLHVPVLSVAPLDEQVDSVHQVRWRVHGQTGDVPAAAPAPEPAPCPPGLIDDDHEPPAIAAPVRPKRQLRPASERVPGRAAPAPELEPAPGLEPDPQLEVVQQPEPEATPLPPAPPGWLTAVEVSELLGCCIATVRNYRHAGKFGREGVGFGRAGKGYRYNPDMVEQLEQGKIPAIGLHQPLNDDADALPAGWESPPG